MNTPLTLVALLTKAEQTFDWGDTTRQDQRWLLQAQLGCSYAVLMTEPKRHVSEDQVQAFWQACERCQHGEPLAYVLGTQPFFEVTLKVTPAVLIPRPETEILVETVLQYTSAKRQVLVDLGTGSGAIALSLAKARPAWYCVAIDSSMTALQVARENQQALQLPLSLFQSHWTDALADASVDIMVSNPPYLSATDPHLTNLSLQAEPRQALVASQAGLGAFIAIIADAKRILRPGGQIFLEHGWHQALVIADLLRVAGFEKVDVIADYADHPRVTFAR